MFAQAPPSTDPETSTAEVGSPAKTGGVKGVVKDQDFIFWSLLLAGLLFVAAVVFFFFDRWRKRSTGETTRETSMSLSSFREMYENGELTESEYEKIKAKMAARLKQTVGVPIPPSAPAPPPPDPTDPPTPPAS